MVLVRVKAAASRRESGTGVLCVHAPARAAALTEEVSRSPQRNALRHIRERLCTSNILGCRRSLYRELEHVLSQSRFRRGAHGTFSGIEEGRGSSSSGATLSSLEGCVYKRFDAQFSNSRQPRAL